MFPENLDKKLVNLVQDIPLAREPYVDLGLRLGVGGDEIMHRIEQLKARGIIRQISPVLDARRLGYQTTLVAMRVAENQLPKATQLLADQPGVSHGYERSHHFNLWFTLAIPPTVDIETELEQLTSSIGAEATFALPAIKVYKIGAYFDMDGGGQAVAAAVTQPDGVLPKKVELSQADRLVINELQRDLPLVPAPFTAMAKRLNMDVDQFLALCQSLRHRSIIRRFGASINHVRVGFKANAMTCWVAPSDTIDAAGQKLTSLREVSHCYERKTNPLWPYNLFAMIHCHTRQACQEIADRVSHETGLMDYTLLFSTKELKKVRVKYLV